MGVNIIKFIIQSKHLEILFQPYLLEHFLSDKISSPQNFASGIDCPQQFGNILLFETNTRLHWSPLCFLLHLSGFDSWFKSTSTGFLIPHWITWGGLLKEFSYFLSIQRCATELEWAGRFTKTSLLGIRLLHRTKTYLHTCTSWSWTENTTFRSPEHLHDSTISKICINFVVSTLFRNILEL